LLTNIKLGCKWVVVTECNNYSCKKLHYVAHPDLYYTIKNIFLLLPSHPSLLERPFWRREMTHKCSSYLIASYVCATTLSIMTSSRMMFSIMTFSIMTFSIMTFIKTTFSLTTLCIEIIKRETRHNGRMLYMLSVIYAECQRYAVCRYI
jgi:hypothetical protein